MAAAESPTADEDAASIDFFLLLLLPALPSMPFVEVRFLMLPVPVTGAAAAAAGSSTAATAAAASGVRPDAMIGRLLDRLRPGEGGNCACALALPTRSVDDEEEDEEAAEEEVAAEVEEEEVVDLRERLSGLEAEDEDEDVLSFEAEVAVVPPPAAVAEAILLDDFFSACASRRVKSVCDILRW
jgi:hypothetical protein